MAFRRRKSDQSEMNYLVSTSDLMAGLLFIFIIALALQIISFNEEEHRAIAVFVKLLFQKFPKKIVINYPAPGTSSRTLGYLCTKADQLIVPETCYHARTVQGGIPMTVTIADRLAFVRGVLF